MKKTILTAMCLSLAFLASGCGEKTTRIDTQNDEGPETMGINYRDLLQAANESINSMLCSPAMVKPGGGRYVMAISDVVNDTMQRLDTDLLVKKIRIALLNSGKVVVTTAVGANGPEDKMSMQARELRNSDEFKQSTVAKKGQMIAPDLSLSGKIVQRNIYIKKRKMQVEYYFQLTVTDINTGLAFWEGETMIGKRGDGRSVAW